MLVTMIILLDEARNLYFVASNLRAKRIWHWLIFVSLLFEVYSDTLELLLPWPAKQFGS